MFKKAISFQESEDKNGYLEKLNEIEIKLEENKNEEKDNELSDLQKKQILWLSLDKEKVKLESNLSNENYDILFFNLVKFIYVKIFSLMIVY